MQWTDEAIVLRIGRFREADLWVRLLSKGRGLFTAFAFGGSRSRRRFTGCLDSFNRISVSISPSRDGRFLNMEEATLLSGPDRLRRDWRRQGIAANCVSFTEAMGVPPDDAEGCHTLLRSMLDLLEDGCEPCVAAPVM
ncbi:MAG: recombination protein O N-terminal domain-containing protein [Mailhella sp.]|nr:recombination protein O N-terminal domain-containing protein [Mailhella sp.]